MGISSRAHSPLHMDLADVQHAAYWVNPGYNVKSNAISLQTVGCGMDADGIIS